MACGALRRCFACDDDASQPLGRTVRDEAVASDHSTYLLL